MVKKTEKEKYKRRGKLENGKLTQKEGKMYLFVCCTMKYNNKIV